MLKAWPVQVALVLKIPLLLANVLLELLEALVLAAPLLVAASTSAVSTGVTSTGAKSTSASSTALVLAAHCF